MAPLTTGVIQAILREFSQQRAGRGRYGGGGAPAGITATGGFISDYTDGPAVYRAHVFTSTGTFDVTAPGGYGDTVEYLVVAGGGGSNQAGGGGGGGAGSQPDPLAVPGGNGGSGIVIIAYPS